MTADELKVIELISKMSIDRASQAFSKMIKAGSRIEIVTFRKIDISAISEEVGNEDIEASGVIVQLIGDAPTKLLFLVGLKDALTLTDLFLRKNIGATKDFDIYVESTIQEIGNILASSISNVFAKDFDINIQPEPPIVLNDFASSIFNTVLMDDEYLAESEILIVQAKFFVVRTAIDCKLYIIPSMASTKLLLEKYRSNVY